MRQVIILHPSTSGALGGSRIHCINKCASLLTTWQCKAHTRVTLLACLLSCWRKALFVEGHAAAT
jgi:hypothetical protein